MNRYSPSKARNFTEDDQAAWSKAVETLYGVRLAPEQFYIARGLLVMCGSEYVAQLDSHSTRPQDATTWTNQISHFPRGTGRLETSQLYRLTSYEAAQEALSLAYFDVCADHGEEAAMEAWADLVRNVAGDCTPGVAAELARREGVQL